MTIKAKKLVPKKSKKSDLTQVTRVALVVDRSGSMMSVQREALSGLNEQINALRANSELTETYVTLIQFDNEIETLYDAVSAGDLEDCTEFIPRGATSLYDAVGTAIAGLKAAKVKDTDDVGYLIIVISDGGENSSKEYSQNVISNEIKQLEATGDWTFTFMLANQDIHKMTAALNLKTANVMAYTSNATGTSTAYGAMACSTVNYLGVRSSGLKSMDNFYGPDQTTPEINDVTTPLHTPTQNANVIIPITPQDNK